MKNIGANLADELYDLSRRTTYESFSDMLRDIFAETSADMRMVTILVAIDFFSDFGNQRELLQILEVFELFKRGTAKQIKKQSVEDSPLLEIIRRHSNGKTKNGADAKSYALTDVSQIIRESEALIKEMSLPDVSIATKVKQYGDAMGGVIYLSGEDGDRAKLYVKDIFPAKRKSDGKQFGYNIVGKSIGSGVETRYTIFNRSYLTEIKKGDIIKCEKWNRDGKYFTITKYSKLS